VKREDFWNLFWLSGMPEAWLMSRPEWGELNAADMKAQARPHVGPDLPREARELRLHEQEQTKTE